MQLAGWLAAVMQPHPPSKPRHGESRGAFKRRMAEETHSLQVGGTNELSGWDGDKGSTSTPSDVQLPKIQRHDQQQHDEQQQQQLAADRLAFVRAVRAGVVREGIERSTPRVGSVNAGEVLEVLEVQTTREGQRRIRTARGWLSERAASGRALLVPSSEQERAARNGSVRLPRTSSAASAVGSERKRRRRRKRGCRPPGGLMVIEDNAEGRLMLRRQRRQKARADAPWRQPVPPLIRHEVVINSHSVTHRRQMVFGRCSGQFSLSRSLHTQDFDDTNARSSHDTAAGSRRRRRTICTLRNIFLISVYCAYKTA